MKPLLKRSLMTLTVLALLGGGGYYLFAGKKEMAAAQRYGTEVLQRGNLVQSVAANGTLNPVTLVNVGTQVSGTVKTLHVDFNSKVQAGQILLELDNALLQAQLKQSSANARSAQASLDLARANEARMNTLLKQEYVSRQDFDSALQARKAAEAQLALYQAQMERDRANLAYSVIRSPVSGVVVDRSVDVGQTVAASFQTPTLFKIAQDLSEMQISSAFAEADIGNIRVGQPVRFTVDAFPDRSFSGQVRQVRLNPTTQQNVVTYNVVVGVKNPEQVLLPGMTAYVNIVTAKRQDVLLVPNAALRFHPVDVVAANGGGKNGNGANGAGGAARSKKKRDANSGTVYLLQGETLKPVTVRLGITDNRYTEVVGGSLKAGDRVVTVDNQPVPETKQGGVQMRLF